MFHIPIPYAKKVPMRYAKPFKSKLTNDCNTKKLDIKIGDKNVKNFIKFPIVSESNGIFNIIYYYIKFIQIHYLIQF